jgi:hypothetical protein
VELWNAPRHSLRSCPRRDLIRSTAAERHPLGCPSKVKRALLVVIILASVSQSASGQRRDRALLDSATRVRLLRELRVAQEASSDSLVLYQRVLAFADSLLTIHRVDATIRQVRLLAAAPVLSARVQRARAVATCTTIRSLQDSVGLYRNASGSGVGCVDCARAAGQLRIAKRTLDSLILVKKCS